ncbi:MAG: hypothetical protein LBL91_05835 [Lachnospiraceae bacterium]|jgi:hypothetical protein|nr:hypothetical protein [Lachnospiraceae bacterium]
MKNSKEKFEEKDFDFLDKYKNEYTNIKKTIEEQNKKRDIIFNILKTHTRTSDTELINKANDLILAINNNIRKLNNLITELENMENVVVNLFVEDNAGTEMNYEKETFKIKFSAYSSHLHNIKNEVLLNAIEIDKFLQSNNINIKTKREPIPEELEGIPESNKLIISENKQKVFLPYKRSELKAFYSKYKKEYDSYDDIIEKEYTYPIEYYTKHPTVARFREAYSLLRDKEMKSVFESLKFALDMMFCYDVNPAIISACNTKDDLILYLNCLEKKSLNEFNIFEIKFEVNPSIRY